MNRYLWGNNIKNLKLKVYKHSYLLLLVPVIIITIPLLKPGNIIGDGDFPFNHNALYPSKVLTSWIDFGSRNTSELLGRYPIIAIGFALQLMNISSEVISKLMIISGFLIASLTFYYSFHLLFGNKTDTKAVKFKAAAILGSLFYAYNLWSFDRISHWYLWIGYSVLPLFFVSLICLFNKPGKKWKYVFLTVLSWSIASSTPHMLVYFGIIFIGVSLFFVIKNIYRKKDLVKSGILILSILFIFVLLNAYWLYPFVLSVRAWSIDPSTLIGIVVTHETTEIFSKNSNFLNVVRLMQSLPHLFQTDVAVPPNTSHLYPLWLAASYLLPILAFSALFFRTFFRYALVFSGLAIIGIILTMGTNTPFNFYSTLLFELPLSSLFRNMIRDPDKFGFLISLAYSFLLSIVGFELLKLAETMRFKKIISAVLLLALIGLITITTSQIYNVPFENKFKPVVIPNDFNHLNNYLKKIETDKILSIPYFTEKVIWNDHKNLSPDLYELSSTKSNIGFFSLLPANYYRYFTSSIISNKTNDIYNYLVPYGTSYIIFHNDTLNARNTNLLKTLSSLRGIENIENVGIFRIFGVDKSILPVNVPNQNILVVGGLDKMTTLSSLDSFNSTRSSLIYLDQDIRKVSSYPMFTSAFSDLVLPRNKVDLILSLLDDKYVIAPFEATNHHDPSRVWSKAGTMDLLDVEFHPYLEELGFQNWDFDYGKGLVVTNSPGAKLSVPFKVEEAGRHDMFFRYLANQYGGLIKIYLDNILVKEVNTEDILSHNKFVWKKIDLHSINLTKGEHTLGLENVVGLNAVNIFTVVPFNEMTRLAEKANSLANNSDNIFLLEAESEFHNSKGGQQYTNNVYSSFNETDKSNNTNNSKVNGSFNGTLRNHFKVPANSDLAALQFRIKQNPQSTSTYNIKNIEVTPSLGNQSIFALDFEAKENQSIFALDFEPKENQSIFALDFEAKENQSIFALDFEPKENQSIFALDFEAKENQSSFTNNNNDVLSISTETNTTISGNGSLRVDIKQGNKTNWNTISTDFIPVNENAYYSSGFDVSAKDVNQLHSKIVYFDSNKKEIKTVFISGGKNGTFEESYNKTDISPIGARYMQLQLWVGSNPIISSRYIIDNLRIENVPLGQVSFTNNNNDVLSISTETNTTISGNGSLRVDIKQGNKTNWNTISTDFIPVNENAYYSSGFDVSAKDVNQLHSKIVYFDSNKKEIKTVFISGGKNGTFEESYNKTDISPIGARYMQLQLWVGSNPIISSRYIIDNLRIENVPLGQVSFTNNNNDVLSISTETNTTISGNGSLRVDIKQGNKTNWNTISTDFIPVNENAYYSSGFDVSAKDVNQLHSKIVYFDSNKKEIKTVFISGGKNGTFEESYNKTDISPIGARYMQLQLWVGSNPIISSRYIIDNLRIENVPLGQVSFTNNNNDVLSISTETNTTISGNGSLRVDIKQGNTDWNTISTDFIPVNENAYYSSGFDVSAKDVNQLHSKIVYFDSNKKEIKTVFISGGKNGTFEESYNKTDISPIGARYMQLQLWVRSNPEEPSSYLIDNIIIKDISNYGQPKNNLNEFENVNPVEQKLILSSNEGFLSVELKKGNSTNYKIIQTKPFPVKNGYLYDYEMNFEGENLNSFNTFASFRSSGDVVENSTKHGANASNGNVLSLSPGSEIYTNLDVLKPSNYTIALRVKTCETCTFLRLSIADDSNNINKTTNISLVNNHNKNSSYQLKWFYSNSTYLPQGKYEIKIFSDSQTDLDLVAVYSIDNVNVTSTKNTKFSETIEELFSANEVKPAMVTEYKKVSPTKHFINISNAKKPYILSFAESYDPLWKVRIEKNNDNFKATDLPLYSMINGFYINKTGDYTLTIEYQPQKWFNEAGTVSIVTLLGLITYSVIQRHNKFSI